MELLVIDLVKAGGSKPGTVVFSKQIFFFSSFLFWKVSGYWDHLALKKIAIWCFSQSNEQTPQLKYSQGISTVGQWK